MSDRRLQKNIDSESCQTNKLFLKPVIISDSKGRYLQNCVEPNKCPENEILWIWKSGATTFERYLWLKENIDYLISKYHALSVYIFTGTCDLTIKQQVKVGRKSKRSKYVQLRDKCCVSLLERHYVMIQRLLQRKQVKVTFLHCPYYSLERYNKRKGHPQPSVFKTYDKTLTEYVNSLNIYIDQLNKQMGTYSPKLNEDLRRSRKAKNKRPRYSWNFNMFTDGIHPKPKLAKSWLKSISRKIKRDCS